LFGKDDTIAGIFVSGAAMADQKMTFQYHPELFAKFPEARAGLIIGRGLNNSPSPEALKKLFRAEQAKVLSEIGETPLSELDNLVSWRKAFRGFGVNPTKYRSAVEALLRRLTKKGDIPSINTLVDIGNLISIRYRLPAAIFDVGSLDGNLTVQFAAGDERFTPLGEKQAEHPEPGEVIFLDSSEVVVARRWCWRQSDESAARTKTSDAIIATEGLHLGAEEDLRDAVNDLVELLAEFSGGTQVVGEIGPGKLTFSG
jgi:DNA/RNA-binding domain of Phe-tRNA-synthetase-like protein